MKQDRRLNGWIVVGSVVEILLSIVFLGVGCALGVLGFLYQNKLAEIDELQFILSQDFFTQFNLKIEYLYLVVGIALAVIGIILLVLAIISLSYAQKRKVVRRRVALFIFLLIPLVITAICSWAVIQLVNTNPSYNNLEYILYGLIGVTGFISLSKLLGIIFGRSEKFMSNDNNKFAFNNSSIKNSRADVNNMNLPQRNNYQAQNQNLQHSSNYQAMPPRPVQQGVPNRQVNPNLPPRRPPQQPGQSGQMPARPIQPQRPMQNTPQARPISPSARPIMPRPQQLVRPDSHQTPQQSQTPKPRKFCPKCGKLLSPEERFCSLCGFKIQ